MSGTLKHRHTADSGATNGKEFRELSPPCLSTSQNVVGGGEEQIRPKLGEKENEKIFPRTRTNMALHG